MFYKLLVILALGLGAVPGFGQTTSRAAARVLEQATWGPTPAAIEDLSQMGLDNWLKSQIDVPQSDIPDQPVLDANGKPNRNLGPVQRAFFENAINGQDQLRQRIAFALSEIWVVSATAGVPDAYAYPVYWRIFRDNAFGNYRDIIKAVTLNPAMGRYLNMANNNKGSAARGTSANENYARETLQLFTLGLSQLNLDGSPVLDASGNPVPTYDQTVVSDMAKALTGWTYPTQPGATPKLNNPAYYIGQMFAVASEHDTSAKQIFGGITIPAGQTAEQDLESVLDAMMQQPSMAPFVSKQLIQHLVTSNPSPAYLQRVAQVFQNTKGDMRAIVTAILTDPEARAGDVASASVDPNFGHLREPVLFVANILRGLTAIVRSKSAVYNSATSMGQQLFYSPSVFSYFSPQYRTEKGLFGPEFQIYSTQTAATRADVVGQILYGSLDRTTTVDLKPLMLLADDTTKLVDTLDTWFLHSAMSGDLKQAAISAANAATTPQRKVQAALYIVFTSGEYQIIH